MEVWRLSSAHISGAKWKGATRGEMSQMGGGIDKGGKEMHVWVV